VGTEHLHEGRLGHVHQLGRLCAAQSPLANLIWSQSSRRSEDPSAADQLMPRGLGGRLDSDGMGAGGRHRSWMAPGRALDGCGAPGSRPPHPPTRPPATVSQASPPRRTPVTLRRRMPQRPRRIGRGEPTGRTRRRGKPSDAPVRPRSESWPTRSGPRRRGLGSRGPECASGGVAAGPTPRAAP
jgi:hypothetical protein